MRISASVAKSSELQPQLTILLLFERNNIDYAVVIYHEQQYIY